MIHKESLNTGVFNMSNSEQAFYSRRELATMFRVTPQSIIRWEQAGLLSSVHLCSGAVRYSRTEVDAFIQRQTAARPTKRRNAEATA
jgi:predicted DNA-binding transcriptional regulator AlpA